MGQREVTLFTIFRDLKYEILEDQLIWNGFFHFELALLFDYNK
jgi:hypothetical protein